MKASEFCFIYRNKQEWKLDLTRTHWSQSRQEQYQQDPPVHGLSTDTDKLVQLRSSCQGHNQG